MLERFDRAGWPALARRPSGMMYGYKGRFFDDGPVGRELKGIGALPDKGMKPTFETSGVGIRTMDE